MTAPFAFSKYQGIGNDFILVEARGAPLRIEAAEVRAICNRRRGVGADGILELREPVAAEATVAMVVHNADGSHAETCGNGLRCVVRHLERSGLASESDPVTVETGAGLVRARLEDGAIVMEMGPARSSGPALRIAGEQAEAEDLHSVTVPLKEREVQGTCISLGNPHLVLFDLSRDHAATLGEEISTHPLFPEGINAGFAHLAADGGIDLTVWERGSGLTLACGTGACAAVAAAVATRRRPSDRWIEVRLPGGALQIKVAEDLSQVWMKGPAAHVFDGTLDRADFRPPVESEP